jgi:hypothetical protein
VLFDDQGDGTEKIYKKVQVPINEFVHQPTTTTVTHYIQSTVITISNTSINTSRDLLTKMQFYTPIAMAIMVAIATARFCPGSNIICTYDNDAGTCIVPCFDCSCPPSWNNGAVEGRNIKSACGFFGGLTGRLQCL